MDDPSIGSTIEDSDSHVVMVSDVNEAPSIALLNTITSIDENTDTSNPIKIADINVADDALGIESLTLSGADASLFEIVGTELFLTANSEIDFESQSTLDVTVEVDDPTLGSTFEDSDSLTITVIDVNEAPSVSLNNQVLSIPEDTNTSTPIKVADIEVSDDALGVETLTLSGTDANLFEIVWEQSYS